MNAGQILLLSTSLLTLLWWGQLLVRQRALIAATGPASWTLGFLLPLPFFAIPLSLARLGLLADFAKWPPPFFLFVLFMFALAFAVARAPIVRAFANEIGVAGLVLFQSFRFLPEAAIAAGVRQGIAPAQLGAGGYNFDVLVACVALLLGVMMKRHPERFTPPRWALGFQLFGAASLVNILVIAITSFPTPLQLFAASQSNEWVAFEPYVLLPGFMVSVAIIGHLLLQQQLSKESP
ncbi:MAG: hypothetical protein KF767_07645 [Bdellovibrionaceae bacterium]|nr:hypothetical protein [Pseudobdellovibrionaceae bacterium]